MGKPKNPDIRRGNNVFVKSVPYSAFTARRFDLDEEILVVNYWCDNGANYVDNSSVFSDTGPARHRVTDSFLQTKSIRSAKTYRGLLSFRSFDDKDVAVSDFLKKGHDLARAGACVLHKNSVACKPRKPAVFL